VSVVCCQVEFSASGWSLIQSSPTECGVSECDGEIPITRKPWPTKGCRAKKKSFRFHVVISFFPSICLSYDHLYPLPTSLSFTLKDFN
jgi:hypothetical protein